MESMSKAADVDLDLAKQNIEEEKEVPKSEASPEVQTKKSTEVMCYSNMAFCLFTKV